MKEFDSIKKLMKVLSSGGLILFPTDSVWAIGCDATNEKAVGKILAIKQRAVGKGLVLLADKMSMIRDYVDYVHPRIDTLMLYHTRPLTIIYDKGINLPPKVLGADGSVAFRVVQDDFCKNIIEQFGKPIVATTANVDSTPIPLHFGAISSDILQRANYIAFHRRDETVDKMPSVMARMSDENEEMIFIRK